MAKRTDSAGSLGQRMRGLRGEARLEAIGEIVARWRESGQSRAAFCRELGIAAVTLSRWISRLDASRPATQTSPVLVEVAVPESHERDVFELVLRGGTRVKVPAGFLAEDLARLLGVLTTAC